MAANTELKAKRTAYDLLHTDWLASQQDLKAHRHVLARLDTMYACSVQLFCTGHQQQPHWVCVPSADAFQLGSYCLWLMVVELQLS